VQAFVIDFEELSSTGGTISTPVTAGEVGVKQFTFTATDALSGGGDTLYIYEQSGDTSLLYCPYCYMEMAHSEGDLFSIYQLDYWGTPWGEDLVDVAVTGFLAGGGTVETSFSYNTSASSGTLVFGSEWTQLEKVVFGQPSGVSHIENHAPTFGTGFDNIHVAPIPAAVWLFGSGLAYLGWLGRKKSSGQ